MKFTFIEWLSLINPNCILRITTEDGKIYQGKQLSHLNYNMSLKGMQINNTTFIF